MDYKWEYSTRSVKGILSNIHRIKEELYRESKHAQVIYADISTTIKEVGLADKQKMVIGELYFKDLTQQEAAANLGICQQALNQNITAACRNIASFLNSISFTKTANKKRPMAYRLLDKGYTAKETAAKLGVNVNTIYTWNHQTEKEQAITFKMKVDERNPGPSLGRLSRFLH